MAVPLRFVARERADLYATRAALVETIKYLAMNDRGLLGHLQSVVAKEPIARPPVTEDVIISDQQIRECLKQLIAEVMTARPGTVRT